MEKIETGTNPAEIIPENDAPAAKTAAEETFAQDEAAAETPEKGIDKEETPAAPAGRADEAFEAGRYGEAFSLYAFEDAPSAAVRQALSHLYTSDPAFADAAPLKEACETARRALDEKAAAGDEEAAAEKRRIDSDIAALVMRLIGEQTELPAVFPSLPAALNACADRLGTAQLLEAAVPLILSEEELTPALEAALSFASTLKTGPVPYYEGSAKKKVTPVRAYAESAEKARRALAKVYNALPARQKTRERLENAVKDAKQGRKDAQRNLKDAESARKRALKEFYAAVPGMPARKRDITLRSILFAVPGAALTAAAAVYAKLGGRLLWLVPAAALLAVGVIAMLLYRKKKTDKLEKDNATEPLSAADAAVLSARKAKKEAGAAVKDAKKSLAGFRATDIK